MTGLFRQARIDAEAITRNVQTLARAVAAPEVLAVVKADGYGHGAVPAARAALAGGAGWLGVVDVDEAIALRAAGIGAPLLSWLNAPDTDYRPAVEAGVDLGVSSIAQLDRVAAAGPAHVHVKVDTGLGRNGVTLDECAALFERAARLQRSGRIRVRGVFSHLANTGPQEDAEQVAAFDAAIAAAHAAGLDPELVHLAATAGALRVPSARYSMVRLGIGIYGLSPFQDASSRDLGLTPAMELSATVASVKRVPAGNGVSYGYTYRTRGPATLALVPLGYADGIPRSASNRGPVWINGSIYRIAGRVAMDQIVVDVGDDPVAVGDRAVLFGDPATGTPSADDWARAADTINYEIVTRIGPRVRRVYPS